MNTENEMESGTDPRDKLAVVEKILERAAEKAGDITGPAMTRFYERCPEGRQLFAEHSRRLDRLEGLMVEQSIYCLMQWFASPMEIEILLQDTVPHHKHTLKIPTSAYCDLLIAAADTIGDTIPEGNTREQGVWNELCGQLLTAIAQCD